MMYKILWADDEIDLFAPHVIFLNKRGFSVTSVKSGEEVIPLLTTDTFDIIFLDHQMDGLNGFETLALIRKTLPHIPIVMISRNDEELVIDHAISSTISEYLLKPINPNQILITCKKLLQLDEITSKSVTESYQAEFSKITSVLSDSLDHLQWINIYQDLVNWEFKLNSQMSPDFYGTIVRQKQDANILFSRFIQREYEKWCDSDNKLKPILSPDILSHYVLPEMQENKSVFLFVIDCMRYDQWIVIEKILSSFFTISTSIYYSILPTVTAFSRNSIFSGLFPLEIQKRFPNLWNIDGDDFTQNANESYFLNDFFARRRLKFDKIRYLKVSNIDDSKSLLQLTKDPNAYHLNAVVINFVDILTHFRTSSQIIKELCLDEKAFRDITEIWFKNSLLFTALKEISQIKNSVTLITTDHGSIRCTRPTKINAIKETTNNLRFKFSSSMQVDSKQTISYKDPSRLKLPVSSQGTSLAIAKEDFFFVYPNNFHKIVNQYKNSFQHGGISMEEILVPFSKLLPK